MLFTDTTILKKYAQIGGSPNLDSFKATLRMVEETHIVTVMGNELFSALELAISVATDDYPLPESFQNLLHQCRMVVGPLFCYYHADKADVFFSDAGMQRVETTSNKTAYQEQRTKFKAANLEEGEKALELLIQFLEKNLDDYTEWTESNYFLEYRSLFIKSGTEFQKYFPSHSPYRNYWAMRSKMQDIEELTIRPFLGDDLFNTLKEKYAEVNPEFTDEEILLLSKIKKAIANLTVAFAIPLLQVRIANNGLTVPAVASFSTNDNDNTRSGADDKTLQVFASTCNGTGIDWLNNAKKYLTSNKTAFPTWIGFETTDDDCDSGNEGLDGVFGMF